VSIGDRTGGIDDKGQPARGVVHPAAPDRGLSPSGREQALEATAFKPMAEHGWALGWPD
jgi:hypothetical protein